MLHSLTIRDFVIVNHLELDFKNGLTVLSGETGAGKSILIDALSLCLGERAEASMVRDGCAKADITAQFGATPIALAWLAEHELTADDQQDILIRRVIDAQGKSKAYVNQPPVTATLLKQLGEYLVDIHGQHAFQSLVKAEEQRRLLDELGQHHPLVNAVGEQFGALKTLRQQREDAQINQQRIAEQRERLAWQWEEIERISPADGEWEQLSLEHTRLSHAAELLEGTQMAVQGISDADDSLITRLAQITQKLEQLARKDEHLQPIVDSLRSADIQLTEASHDLNHYLRRADLDPDRLAVVDERISRWHATARKLRIPPEELAQRAQAISAELKQLDASTDTAALDAAIANTERAYQQAAGLLTQARQKLAKQLSSEVTEAMQGLSLKGGRFVCELVSCTATAFGTETIEFRVAGHEGSQPRPLSKVASGGELARISLAIAVITSQASTVPTLIFDEVDSGIGGAVAEVVGKYLQQLAQQRQVLCVTHLPQVASQGHQHWVVEKRPVKGQTISDIRPVSEQERVQEIARMLGGQVITDKTTAAAEEMLGLANRE